MRTVGYLLALTAGMLLQCTGQRLAGAGSETTNGITGCVLNSDNTPAVDAVVRLFPEEYDPVAGGGIGTRSDTTDALGTYRFHNLQPGRYNVLARDAAVSTGLLVNNIIVNPDAITPVLPDTLATTGSITTEFCGDTTVATGSYLYIPGTDVFAHVGNDGTALLDNVPPGTLAAVMLAEPDNGKRNILRSEVTVASRDTVTIRNPMWKYSCVLVFNTTASGAGIPNDVHGFPVLVRLTPDNFDFSQAAIDGSDLRFDGGNGTPAAFEIERWDAAAGRADVWVRIDTLRGNSSGQSITMYWGNPSVADGSNSASVFDTGSGFAGVWHLGGNAEDSVRDATANRIHGASPGTTPPPATDGVIGACRSFNGATDYITMPNSAGSRINFPQNGHYTVSSWVFVENIDNHSHVIVSKGNTQYFLWHTPIHLNATHWEFADYRDGSGWDLSVSPITRGQWVLLTGVRDGTVQYLYVNGERVDTLIDYPYPFGSAARSTIADLMIGRFAQIMASPNNDEGYCFFNGKIDEVRICSVARSAEWVRLCYMNQQTDDKMISFKLLQGVGQ